MYTSIQRTHKSQPFTRATSSKPGQLHLGNNRKIRAILNLQQLMQSQAIAQDSQHKQTKLAVGTVGDKYEQEADKVADQVMAMPLSGQTTQQGTQQANPLLHSEEESLTANTVQAKALSNGSCASAPSGEQGENEDEQLVQKKEQAGSPNSINPQFSAQLQQSAASGKKLPSNTRQDMEARFGHSFSQVRIHTDQQAVAMTQQVNAEAFATGNHIYLNAGRYQPESSSGQRLLAHELTHVLQQRKGSEKMVGSQPISNVAPATLQRYELKGFPTAKEALMHSAIATAIATVSSCDYLNWLGKLLIKTALRRMRYDFVPDLGLCGWTFPASWYIEVGEQAFDHSSCCDLASTLAHEASHTEWYTEGRARNMECECFDCSCSK